MTHTEAIAALQAVVAPDGWRAMGVGLPWCDVASWETVGQLRAIVTARAMDGCKRGWYRVRCGTIQGGRGARIEMMVRAEGLQRAVEVACGWALGEVRCAK